jgi:hypothetical protein
MKNYVHHADLVGATHTSGLAEGYLMGNIYRL